MKAVTAEAVAIRGHHRSEALLRKAELRRALRSSDVHAVENSRKNITLKSVEAL